MGFRVQGFWIHGFLGFWVSGFLGFWISGFLGFWASGFLDFRISGFLGVWVSGILGFWVSGFLGFWVKVLHIRIQDSQFHFNSLSPPGSPRCSSPIRAMETNCARLPFPCKHAGLGFPGSGFMVKRSGRHGMRLSVLSPDCTDRNRVKSWH